MPNKVQPITYWGNTMNNAWNIVARVLMSQLFIISGFQKIVGYGGSIAYFVSLGLPMPGVLVAATIVVEVGAGLALLFGFRTQWAAAVLAIFTIATAFIAHLDFSNPTQVVSFQKNLAIAGGLILFMVYGAGRTSLDNTTVIRK